MAQSGSKLMQPHNAEFGALSKVHLRTFPMGGREWNVVTLRAGTRARWSTNFFHETWHIVSDKRGSGVLARLLWGLSMHKRPNTLVVLHGEHIEPTPFEAEPSDPIVLLNCDASPADAKVLRELKARLPRLGPSQSSARWQSWGLDRALEEDRDGDPWERWRESSWQSNRHLWRHERMARLGGCVCYTAPPAILQLQALTIARLSVRPGQYSDEMDYHYIAEDRRRPWRTDGEVQIFCDYQARLSHARVARREVLGEAAESGHNLEPEALRQAIYDRVEQIMQREKSKAG